ncbi:MCE family protein [Nocardioides sp. W3-2-3]|uniref:MlaD family protein n=1 Tax=Nocardioides convexus TaxID=2712224 RepID=UPI0024185ED5|nr:MlaD family protein [Nocardioides convexus]NHA00066.1 MCE family protein [Nocardioides convexus]
MTYRGVTVGKVDTMTVGPAGVRLDLESTKDQPIPRDVAARVRMLSALGESLRRPGAERCRGARDRRRRSDRHRAGPHQRQPGAGERHQAAALHRPRRPRGGADAVRGRVQRPGAGACAPWSSAGSASSTPSPRRPPAPAG